MSNLESTLQRKCQQIIRENEGFVFKTHGNIYSRAGIPDLVACIPATIETLQRMLENGWFKDDEIGIFVSLEVKRPSGTNEVSDAQRIVGKEIQNSGGLWFTVDETDSVKAILKMIRGEI